jgi:hypothetical protein
LTMAIAPHHAAETPENHRRRPLISYARVSTEEHGTDPQCDELRAAGCATVTIPRATSG